MKTTVIESANLAPPRNRFAADLAELVKARLTLLVVLTTAVGFYLGSESPVNYGALSMSSLNGSSSGQPPQSGART
jgi:heme O synthase-like polyprenyltransferase